MRHNRILGAGLTMCVGLITTSVLAAPAQADLPGLGQGACPILGQAGSKLFSAASNAANVASEITGKQGPSPEMAGTFGQMAVSGACPDVFASLTKGQLPNIPFVMTDRPDVPGLFGGSPDLPGLPGGLPGLIGSTAGVPGQ